MTPTRRRPDVILIVLDTARAFDVSVSFPGQGEPTTPGLEGLAERGLTFTRASTPAPWTLPSHASLFTGLTPRRHGVYDGGLDRTGPPTLAQVLAGVGYHTYAVVANELVGPDSGLDRGFERFVLDRDPNPDLGGIAGRAAARLPGGRARLARRHRAERFTADRGGGRVATMATELARRADPDRPMLLFLNLLENHLPYHAPADLAARFLPPGTVREDYDALMLAMRGRRLGAQVETAEEAALVRGMYRATLAYADHLVSRLISGLRAVRDMDSALLIVTSDHGENCGEHGMIDHQFSVYDTVLRIPLVVCPPGGADAVRRDDLATLCDVLPTVCEVCGVAAPDCEGRSLLHPIDRDEVVSEYRAPRLVIDWLDKLAPHDADVERWKRDLVAVRTPTRKYIRASDGAEELYEIDSDPWETREVGAAHDDLARLRAVADRWTQQRPRPVEWTNDSLEESMRALGYID